MEAKLKESGWFLSSEGIAECEKACNKEKPSFQELSKAALNLDLKQYGMKHLPDDINRGKVQSVNGPMVLQVQKLRNIAAPKANEESNNAPRLLKIQLTDGHLTCHGLEIASIPDLSLSVPPGTKVYLTGAIIVQESFLMLDSNNTKVLGGEVEKLKEKWELNKTLAKHSRLTVSGDGPPPFVPFSQGTQSGIENRARVTENPKVNGVVQNSTEKPKSSHNKEAYGPPLKPKTTDNGRHNKPTNQEQKDGTAKKFANSTRDDRTENRRHNTEKLNHSKYTSEGKTSVNNPRERETRPFNSESPTNDRGREGHQANDDRQNNRTERSEGIERPHARGPALRPQDTNRGGARPRGRGGRREPAGRGRQENEGVDDMEDYRARQPSEPALWDFLSTKFPTVKDTKNQKPQKSIDNQKTDEVQQERPPPRPPPKQENDTEKQKHHKQDTKVEKTANIPPTSKEQVDTQREYTTPREVEKPKQGSSPQSRDGRQQSKQQREPHYKQQQNPGQTKGKGSRRYDHDSRSYNQSLPPRLQRKQQQQQQQRHQQQQHHHNQHYQQHSRQQETEVNSDEAEYASAGSPPSVAQEDDAILRFSAGTVTREYADEPPSQLQQPVQFRERQSGSYTGQPYAGQGKWQKNYRQGSDQFRPQSFTPPNVQQQQQQHLEFVTMAMESQRSQTQFVVSQPQQFVEQAGREQTDMGMPQEYQYTQHTQPPVQAYPVYHLRPAQMAQQPMAPQPTMPQQPVATQLPATQVGWKKGDHCLAPWRDGQGETTNSQPPPTSAVATVPYYAQPAPVSMVTRPQVVIPVSGQPPFHAATRPTIVHSPLVPTQVHWQPAQVQYQEVRPAAFQPVMHYGAVPQTSTGGPGQPAYGVATATGTGVHYVRGMKDTQVQDVYSSNPEAGRGRSSPNSSGYSKPRRPNRATQSYYVPPRQQKFKDKG